jgi:hypothetical protein
VAAFLLDEGLDWADGVVFLDEMDKKKVLVRVTRRVVDLNQAGIEPVRLFALFDQVRRGASPHADGDALWSFAIDAQFLYAEPSHLVCSISADGQDTGLSTAHTRRCVSKSLFRHSTEMHTVYAVRIACVT